MRNAPHKITLAATFALAIVSAFSCSSGGGGGSGGNDTFGSCIGTSLPELGLSRYCAENLSKNDCSQEGGTFSIGGVCNKTAYPYCLMFVGSSVSCGTTGDANCLIESDDGEDGFLLVTAANCGGSTGSCVISFKELDGLGYCLETPENLCNTTYKTLFEEETAFSVEFKSGTCNTEQYPCCFIDEEGIIGWFGDNFSKDNCIARGGLLASSAICAFL